MEFIEKLTELMKKNQINSIKLQNDTGISESTFRNWKKGSSPTAERLIILAKYFNISTDELLCINSPDNDTLITNLTLEEKELINYFRQLPEKEKYKLLGKLEVQIENYKTKE